MIISYYKNMNDSSLLCFSSFYVTIQPLHCKKRHNQNYKRKN